VPGDEEVVGEEGAMKMTQAEFAELAGRARDGDDDAIRLLLDQLEPDVRLAVRKWLPRLLRTQFDSMDFVQRVWTSVFARQGLDPTQFEKREHLLGYLNGVAHNKVTEEYRRRTKVQKYNLRREESLYVKRGDREEPMDLPGSDPTPSAALQREDCLARLTAGRADWEAEVIRLREAGLTYDQIAERTGVSDRTARRVIEDLRRKMEDHQWL
jgi:RNA polymerase sigma-70 factor (ECF subfamily)